MKAAGLFDRTADAFSVFLMAGHIMHDSLVNARVTEKVMQSGKSVLPDGAYEQVLLEMTPQERADLKHRILTVHGKKS